MTSLILQKVFHPNMILCGKGKKSLTVASAFPSLCTCPISNTKWIEIFREKQTQKMREKKLKCTQKDFTKRKVGIKWKKNCKIKKSIYEIE